MKKIFYFIIVLISIYCISCKRGQIENKNVFLDSDSTFLESDPETDSEFDWDKYYDSLPDSILVTLPNGVEAWAERGSNDIYSIFVNNHDRSEQYWFYKNGKLMDKRIIQGFSYE